MISALKALRPIEKNEELFALYRYPFLKSPTWFMKNFLQFIDENPDQFEKLGFITEDKTLEELKNYYNNVVERETHLLNE